MASKIHLKAFPFAGYSLKLKCISKTQKRLFPENLVKSRHYSSASACSRPSSAPKQRHSDGSACPETSLSPVEGVATEAAKTSNTELNLNIKQRPRPHEWLPFCHPFGFAPPPIQDVYLDGPPPVCALEKFQWVWEGQTWTYRFTVIENRRRVSRKCCCLQCL